MIRTDFINGPRQSLVYHVFSVLVFRSVELRTYIRAIYPIKIPNTGPRTPHLQATPLRFGALLFYIPPPSTTLSNAGGATMAPGRELDLYRQERESLKRSRERLEEETVRGMRQPTR